MISKREAMLAKIRALRAKTEAAGATEHEAMAAAEMASKLMSDWEIEEADLAAAEHREPEIDMGHEQTHTQGQVMPKVWACVPAINRLARVRIVHRTMYKEHRFTVVGDRPDREFALWLLKTIQGAMDRDYAAFARRNKGRLGTGAKASFQIGMAARICERMAEMCELRDAQHRVVGTALVLVDSKRVAVNRLTEELFPRLRRLNTSYSPGNGNAFAAGKAAGDGVGFGRPVGGGGQLRIGSR